MHTSYPSPLEGEAGWGVGAERKRIARSAQSKFASNRQAEATPHPDLPLKGGGAEKRELNLRHAAAIASISINHASSKIPAMIVVSAGLRSPSTARRTVRFAMV